MLSLNNAFEQDGDGERERFREVAEFERRIEQALDRREPVFSVEPKLDGLAISLRYEHGVFVQGATRGDGETVLRTSLPTCARSACAIPLRLRGEGWPRVLEVRGEVIMRRARISRRSTNAPAHTPMKGAWPIRAMAPPVRCASSTTAITRPAQAQLFSPMRSVTSRAGALRFDALLFQDAGHSCATGGFPVSPEVGTAHGFDVA